MDNKKTNKKASSKKKESTKIHKEVRKGRAIGA